MVLAVNTLNTIGANLMRKKISEYLIAIGFVITLASPLILFGLVAYQIDRAGGIKQVIIDTGKGVKDIYKEVEEH